jgi:hypothetical protein
VAVTAEQLPFRVMFSEIMLRSENQALIRCRIFQIGVIAASAPILAQSSLMCN